MNTDDLIQSDYDSYARQISEIFEQDSRRFSRALSEEDEVKG